MNYKGTRQYKIGMNEVKRSTIDKHLARFTKR